MKKIHFDQDYKEWLEALENTILSDGEEYSADLINKLLQDAKNRGLNIGDVLDPPFKNSVSNDEEIEYPGDLSIEEKIRHYIRWNSMLMVLNANKTDDLGGHISTYSSAATLYEVGFNHFFKGNESGPGDLIYYQGHSSPIYARSFLERRFTAEKLDNFRKEINGDGLSSYPHPWLMPEYWEFPTVSMGLGPIFGIYQAHVMKYLEK